MPQYPIPDFDQYTTRNGSRCSGCGLGRPETDDHVTRFDPPIDMEGHFDLCSRCIGEAAATYGWVAPHTASGLEQAVREARAAAESAVADRDDALKSAEALKHAIDVIFERERERATAPAAAAPKRAAAPKKGASA